MREEAPDAEHEREFRDFVESRSKSLLHTAYLLTGDWEQGRDLLQTALAGTARRWAKLNDRDSPDAYVRRALYHAHVDRFRRLGWGRETATAEPPEHAPSGTGLDHADAVAQRRDLVAALRQARRHQPTLRTAATLSTALVVAGVGTAVGTLATSSGRPAAMSTASMTPTVQAQQGPVKLATTILLATVESSTEGACTDGRADSDRPAHHRDVLARRLPAADRERPAQGDHRQVIGPPSRTRKIRRRPEPAPR